MIIKYIYSKINFCFKLFIFIFKMSENLSQPHGKQPGQDQSPDAQPESAAIGDPPSSGLDARQSESMPNADGGQARQISSSNQMVTNKSG